MDILIYYSTWTSYGYDRAETLQVRSWVSVVYHHKIIIIIFMPFIIFISALIGRNLPLCETSARWYFLSIEVLSSRVDTGYSFVSLTGWLIVFSLFTLLSLSLVELLHVMAALIDYWFVVVEKSSRWLWNNEFRDMKFGYFRGISRPIKSAKIRLSLWNTL